MKMQWNERNSRINPIVGSASIGANYKPKWKCKQCGICCRFIVIPVAELIDMDTEAYLEAHGIIYDGKKVIIPAVCQYLQRLPGFPRRYKCMIHNDKFANCRLGGEKECKEAQKAWSLLRPKS